MKVAAVFHEMGPETGGSFTFQRALYDAIRRASTQHEFAAWSTGASTGTDDQFRRIKFTRGAILGERARATFHHAQDAHLNRRLINRPSAFARALETDNTDIVWFITNYAQEVDLPYIFTIWDVEYMRQPWFPEVSRRGEWEARDHYYKHWLAKATRVIVPNAAGSEQLMRYYRLDRERLLEISHPAPGLDRHEAASADPVPILERLGVRPPYVFYPAQFWAHKNHLRILEALTELPGFRAVFVGSDKGGGLAHVREQARELGVAERVIFPGFVETEELIALYRGATALVYPSLFGPENLPPLEAFELGCPVVVADVPGFEEQLGDAAIRVEPFDSSAYADAIRTLHADAKKRDKLVERGRERVKGFSADDYVARVVEFLDEFEKLRRLWK